MPHKPNSDLTYRLGWAVVLACLGTACDGLVGASLECDKICITSVGPTVPGSTLPIDGGVPAGLASQPATMEFNVPLAQLSKAVAEIDVEAYPTSLTLMAPTDLAFVDTVQVTLRAGTTDGGVPRADASAAGGPPGTMPDAATLVPVMAAPPDAGPLPIFESELPSIQASRCLAGGPGFPLASYHKPATAGGSVGRTLALVPTTREANLYDCLRGVPSKFEVALGILPAYLPATDSPLSLKVCISARASGSYP